jgi:hypothetical protein
LQQALEDEVSDFLGPRPPSGRGDARAPPSIATASSPGTAETTGLPIEVERSRVRNARALGVGR